MDKCGNTYRMIARSSVCVSVCVCLSVCVSVCVCLCLCLLVWKHAEIVWKFLLHDAVIQQVLLGSLVKELVFSSKVHIVIYMMMISIDFTVD